MARWQKVLLWGMIAWLAAFHGFAQFAGLLLFSAAGAVIIFERKDSHGCNRNL